MIDEENPKLKAYIIAELEKIEKFFFDFAMGDEGYAEIFETPLEDLPPMMSDGSELAKKLVAARLKGEVNIASPVYTHQVLFNMELSTEEVEEINHFDGKATVLKEISDVMGWEDLSKRADDCIYNP